MGSFPSRDAERAAVEEAAANLDFYAWAPFSFAIISTAARFALMVTLVASVYIFALCALERYSKVTTPLRALQARTLKELYAASWAIGVVLASLNFVVGGYVVQPSGLYCNVDAKQVVLRARPCVYSTTQNPKLTKLTH